MNASALLARLQHASAAIELATLAAGPPTPRGPVRQVAVCDDDLAFIRYVERALGTVDVAVTPITTPSHDEAVRILASSRCDAALLDLHMYDAANAGLRLAGRLRGDPHTAALPLYLATADLRGAQRNRDELTAQGCHLLLKPFGLAELISALHLGARANIV